MAVGTQHSDALPAQALPFGGLDRTPGRFFSDYPSAGHLHVIDCVSPAGTGFSACGTEHGRSFVARLAVQSAAIGLEACAIGALLRLQPGFIGQRNGLVDKPILAAAYLACRELASIAERLRRDLLAVHSQGTDVIGETVVSALNGGGIGAGHLGYPAEAVAFQRVGLRLLALGADVAGYAAVSVVVLVELQVRRAGVIRPLHRALQAAVGFCRAGGDAL
ncbi:hypothetical protein D3C76_1009110 [compost metagenome]